MPARSAKPRHQSYIRARTSSSSPDISSSSMAYARGASSRVNRGSSGSPLEGSTRCSSTSAPSPSRTCSRLRLEPSAVTADAHRFRGVQIERAGEDPQPAQQRLLPGAQELVAPRRRRADAPMPGRCVHRSIRQHPEQVGRLRRPHPGQQCRRWQQRGAAGGQFDRQRHPAELPADGGDRRVLRPVSPRSPPTALDRSRNICTAGPPGCSPSPVSGSTTLEAQPEPARLVTSTTRSGSARWARPMALAGPTSWSASCKRSKVSSSSSTAFLLGRGWTDARTPPAGADPARPIDVSCAACTAADDRCRQVGRRQVGQLQEQQPVAQPPGDLERHPGLADPALPGDRHQRRIRSSPGRRAPPPRPPGRTAACENDRHPAPGLVAGAPGGAADHHWGSFRHCARGHLFCRGCPGNPDLASVS